MRIRYVAPIIGPLVILAVLGLRSLTELVRSRVSSGAGAGLAAAAAVLMLLPNMGYIVRTLRKGAADRLPVRAGSAATNIFSDTDRNTPLSATPTSRLPADAKVLGVFLGNRRYYCDRTLVFDGTLEAGPSNPPVRPGTVAARVREKGYSHIVIGAERVRSLRACGSYPARRARGRSRRFWTITRAPCSAKTGYYLLELKDEGLTGGEADRIRVRLCSALNRSGRNQHRSGLGRGCMASSICFGHHPGVQRGREHRRGGQRRPAPCTRISKSS